MPADELKRREDHIKESWVKAMEARLVREELQKCYRGEGVNHLQNCKSLAEQYARMIRENKVSKPFSDLLEPNNHPGANPTSLRGILRCELAAVLARQRDLRQERKR